MSTRSPLNAEHLLQHAAFVGAVARATLHGDDLVEDVVQATWLAALAGERQRRGPLAPWLAGVARNQARNLLRKRQGDRRRERRVARPESVPPQQDVVDRLEIERRLVHAVERLPERYRTPLVLRYLDGLPPRVIAVRLGLPVDTVRTRVRRGLAQLRVRLEADHGAEARDWRLALLPLVPREGASATALLGASGGLLMTAKFLVPLVALVLLLGGTLWFLPDVLAPGSKGSSESVGVADAPLEQVPAPAAPPALVGHPGPAHGSGGGAALPGPDAGDVPPEGRPDADAEVDAASAMRDLLADIRRNVAPEWWALYPEHATLEARNRILIARAPPDVLDAIASYLDARRREHPLGLAEPPPPDADVLAAARPELQSVLRGILERERQIAVALAAWEAGDRVTARAVAEQVLAAEPDNDYARAILADVAGVAGPERNEAEAVAGREKLRARIQDARQAQTLSTWFMRWPSVLTWKQIQAGLAKAAAGEVRRLAPDIGALLEQGSVSLEVADARLRDVVRALQIETLADIRLSDSVAEEAGRLRIQGFTEQARSLRWILDALVARLPEGWAWYVARQQVVLTRTDGDHPIVPETRLRYFDVMDLLEPGGTDLVEPRPPGSGPPPAPPAYRPGPEGGPPVRVEER